MVLKIAPVTVHPQGETITACQQVLQAVMSAPWMADLFHQMIVQNLNRAVVK